jgi:hypothetical protein
VIPELGTPFSIYEPVIVYVAADTITGPDICRLWVTITFSLYQRLFVGITVISNILASLKVSTFDTPPPGLPVTGNTPLGVPTGYDLARIITGTKGRGPDTGSIILRFIVTVITFVVALPELAWT